MAAKSIISKACYSKRKKKNLNLSSIFPALQHTGSYHLISCYTNPNLIFPEFQKDFDVLLKTRSLLKYYLHFVTTCFITTEHKMLMRCASQNPQSKSRHPPSKWQYFNILTDLSFYLKVIKKTPDIWYKQKLKNHWESAFLELASFPPDSNQYLFAARHNVDYLSVLWKHWENISMT